MNTVYILMDFWDLTLSHVIFNHHIISKSQKLKIIYDIACGLAELHKNNIIHLDLKP